MILFLSALAVIALVFIVVCVDEHRRASAFRQKHPDVFEPEIARTRIIGDGAWITTQAQYPKKNAQPREIEPRGA